MTDPKAPDVFGEEEEGSSVRRALALPDVIDQRYRVLARLGAGAMGIVLRAEDLFLQRPVALKVVEPDPQVASRFIKEAQALAQVRHENVVQVYAFGPVNTSHYLAMELVAGPSLEALIDGHTHAGTTIPLARATALIRGIGEGLTAVHARKLVHRDVKPANVIVEAGTDRPVLIDFGLARRRTKSSPKMSITGGTPSYMAPEQSRDPDGLRVTARTDLYAFAATIFELLTGQPVFEGTDIYTVLLAHMNDPPRRISTLRPELEPLDDILIRALAKDPDDRYATVSEMVAALEAAIARVGKPKPAPVLVPSILVAATDSGLRRSLVRNTIQALRAREVALPCETVGSVEETIAFIEKGHCELLVIDEETAPGRLGEVIELLRARRASAEVVVVSRDLPAVATALGVTKVRHFVPKPVNVHVFAAVLARLRLAQS